MSVPRRQASQPPGATALRRGGKGRGRQPNRAQLRAVEARSRAAGGAETAAVTAESAADVRRTRTQGSVRGEAVGQARARAVARPVVLTREEEYHYIRGDLHRLLITAGALLLLMLVLLLIVRV